PGHTRVRALFNAPLMESPYVVRRLSRCHMGHQPARCPFRRSAQSHGLGIKTLVHGLQELLDVVSVPRLKSVRRSVPEFLELGRQSLPLEEGADVCGFLALATVS